MTLETIIHHKKNSFDFFLQHFKSALKEGKDLESEVIEMRNTMDYSDCSLEMCMMMRAYVSAKDYDVPRDIEMRLYDIQRQIIKSFRSTTANLLDLFQESLKEASKKYNDLDTGSESMPDAFHCEDVRVRMSSYFLKYYRECSFEFMRECVNYHNQIYNNRSKATLEHKVIHAKEVGDIYRYMSEMNSNDKEVIESARVAYEAVLEDVKCLPASSEVRLVYSLNYCIFSFEFLQRKNEAINYISELLREVPSCEDIKSMSAHQYNHFKDVVNLLKENLNYWEMDVQASSSKAD